MVEAIRRKKVMVVDDSEIVLVVSRRVLEAAGFDVATHARPVGCITLILQEMPDLLLIDVNMPGLNGDTVVRMLGSTRASTAMIILLHSSLQEDVLAQKAKAASAHGYIRKSDNPQVLVREVSRWIRPGTTSGAHKLDVLMTTRTSSGTRLEGARAGDSQEAFFVKDTSTGASTRKLLLVDHDMLALSEYRELTKSVPCTVEFALSGSEVVRRLQSNGPPDVVVLGELVGKPSVQELLHQMARLGSRWRSCCVVLNEETVHDWPMSLAATRLSRPFTEAQFCRAIQNCMRYAS